MLFPGKLMAPAPGKCQSPTVRDVCDIYLRGHIKNRAEKGRVEIRRTFDLMLAGIADHDAATVTRKVASVHLSDSTTSQCRRRCCKELRAAWDYRPDSGDLPQTAPNGWRSALRGKLKSKERAKLVDESQGQRLGSCADREPVGQPDEVRSKLARGPVKTSRVTRWLWTTSSRGKVSASIGSPRAA